MDDGACIEMDIGESWPTRHGDNIVYSKFKLEPRVVNIGQSQRNGTELQVQRTNVTIISERNHGIRS